MPVQLFPTRAMRVALICALLGGLYCGLAIWKENSPLRSFADFPPLVEAALSFAIGVLIVFRVNRAYERWWEARTLWGALVNASRNIALQYHSYGHPNRAESQKMRQHITGFASELQDHLKGRNPDDSHRPAVISQAIFQEVNRLHLAGRIDIGQLQGLDRETSRLMDICGGCERIRNTLMPLSFRWLVRQCVVLYLLLLPWGIVDICGYWTIPVTMLVVYFILSAELVAGYVEEPFGDTEDHLKLDTIIEGIDRSVAEILGVSELSFQTETSG